jgi:hypothetical protein
LGGVAKNVKKVNFDVKNVFCMVTYILNTIGDALLIQVYLFPLLPSFSRLEERIILKTLLLLSELAERSVEAFGLRGYSTHAFIFLIFFLT